MRSERRTGPIPADRRIPADGPPAVCRDYGEWWPAKPPLPYRGGGRAGMVLPWNNEVSVPAAPEARLQPVLPTAIPRPAPTLGRDRGSVFGATATPRVASIRGPRAPRGQVLVRANYCLGTLRPGPRDICIHYRRALGVPSSMGSSGTFPRSVDQNREPLRFPIRLTTGAAHG
jgi:hypothetical protein